MHIAWTTVAQLSEAESLACTAIAQNLAVCVQIDGPVVSHYLWQGKPERTQEYRLSFKCTGTQLPALEQYVRVNHPYETPEWIVIEADQVGEKYLSWANANSSNLPFKYSQPSL